MARERAEAVARQYAILKKLDSTRSRSSRDDQAWLCSTDDLRELCKDYERYPGQSASERSRASKLLDRDLEKLAARGLVQTGVSDGDRFIHAAQGVRLRTPEKPVELHLSPEEHQAIQRARDVLNPQVPRIIHGQTPSDLDIADSAVFWLMERNGRAKGPELAAGLGVPAPKLRRLLEAVAYGDHLKDEAALVPLDICDEVGGWVVELNDTHIQRAVDKGLGQVGRFAYTRAEVDERLALLTAALDHAAVSDADKELIRSATGKLQRWRSAHLNHGDGRRRGDPGSRRGRHSRPAAT